MAVAKDEEKDIAVAAEVKIADDLRSDLRGRDVIIASLRSSYTVLETAYGALEVKSQFWEDTANDLDGFRLFGIPFSCVAGAGAAAGYGGMAAGAAFVCGVSLFCPPRR